MEKWKGFTHLLCINSKPPQRANARAELTEYCTGHEAGKVLHQQEYFTTTSGTCTGVIFLRKNKEVLKNHGKSKKITVWLLALPGI